MDSVAAILDSAAAQVRAAVGPFAGQLTPADHRRMAVAFHRAESLALNALRQALGQVGGAYRSELEEQIADEARHVDVFALGDATPEVAAPAGKRRDEPVWFALLLVNEIAGFCQFHLLAALDEAAAGAALAIAEDERRHIERLARWLTRWRRAPVRETIERIGRTFVKNLPGRMTQFVVNPDLDALNHAMIAIIAGAVSGILEYRVADDDVAHGTVS